MTSFLPLDMHAHIQPDIPPKDLTALNAVVFAATRRLAEARVVLTRTDETTVWGVGCHPGLVGVQKTYDPDVFRSLIADSPLVSEIGLDGASRTPMQLQRENFLDMLRAVADRPRLVSVHSFAATTEVLDTIEEASLPRSIILHWWLGDAAQTQRALKLGCYFSVNASSVRKWPALTLVPLDRLFFETDHPFGDRSNRLDARPGNVADVEAKVALLHGVNRAVARRASWTNLSTIVRLTGTFSLFPRRVRVLLSVL